MRLRNDDTHGHLIRLLWHTLLAQPYQTFSPADTLAYSLCEGSPGDAGLDIQTDYPPL